MTIIFSIFFPFDFKTFLWFNNELANVVEKGVKPCGFYILQLVCPSCIKKTTSETFLLLHLVIYVKLEQQSL